MSSFRTARRIGLMVATLSVLASSAHAFAVHFTSDFSGDALAIGDRVNLQVHLDAPTTGIHLLGLNLVFSPTLRYNPQPNIAVGVKSYILYGTGGGPGQLAVLYPQQDPWQYWPAPPQGLRQVNINWADPRFVGTNVTGLGLKIAEIQLELVGIGTAAPFATLSTDFGGGVFQVNGVNDSSALQGIPKTLTFIPEPSTASLITLGLVALAACRRPVLSAGR